MAIDWKDITRRPPPAGVVVLCKGNLPGRDSPLAYLARSDPRQRDAGEGRPLLWRDNEGCGFTVGCYPTHWAEWEENTLSPVGHATEVLRALSEYDRTEVFGKFCRGCGTDRLPCRCWNDE